MRSFHNLYNIIEEEKAYKKAAKYIVENDVNLADFLHEVLSIISESADDKVLEEACFLLNENSPAQPSQNTGFFGKIRDFFGNFKKIMVQNHFLLGLFGT
jgi:hypothetical protein